MLRLGYDPNDQPRLDHLKGPANESSIRHRRSHRGRARATHTGSGCDCVRDPTGTVAGSTSLYARDVKSAVTVSGAATITLTNLAYRHPEVVQATKKVTAAGSYSIHDRCKPSTLPYTWIVKVNGVEVAHAKLKCR